MHLVSDCRLVLVCIQCTIKRSMGTDQTGSPTMTVDIHVAYITASRTFKMRDELVY